MHHLRRIFLFAISRQITQHDNRCAIFNGAFFFLMIRRAPTSTLFPYTTLFRSRISGWSSFRYAYGLSRGGPAVCPPLSGDRKSTRLNSSHANISYAVFCSKKNNAVSSRSASSSCISLRCCAPSLMMTWQVVHAQLPPHACSSPMCIFFNDTTTTAIYTLSLHDALPI